MTTILSGKEVASEMRRITKAESLKLKEKGIVPTIGIIRVGSRQDDIAYERGIIKNCDAVGIEAKIVELPEDVNMDDFSDKLHQINEDDHVHGILIFRPLPKQLDEERIKYMINPQKDIDCMNPQNMVKIFEGSLEGFLPCTPSAVMEILKYYKVNLNGINAAVLGRSMVVGKPLSMMLLNENATVTICHSRTKNLEETVLNADLVVAAIGKAKFVNKDFIKSGTIVIDVGINLDENGKMCGDVDYDEVSELADMITPVPGGVGSVTTSILLKNVIKAANNKSLKVPFGTF